MKMFFISIPKVHSSWYFQPLSSQCQLFGVMVPYLSVFAIGCYLCAVLLVEHIYFWYASMWILCNNGYIHVTVYGLQYHYSVNVSSFFQDYFIKQCIVLARNKYAHHTSHLHHILRLFQGYTWGMYVHVCVIYEPININLRIRKVDAKHNSQTTVHVIGIYQWITMAATLQYMSHCSPLLGHMDTTLVHTCTKTQPTAAFTPHVTATYVPESNITAKLHIYGIYLKGLYRGYICLIDLSPISCFSDSMQQNNSWLLCFLLCCWKCSTGNKADHTWYGK